MKSAVPSVLIVAAEESSTLYARRLLEFWSAQGQEVCAFGVGNQAMIDQGFEALGRSEDMAVVGLQEVLAHWSVIKTAFYRLTEAAEERRPRFALLLDYPDFNLRLARKLKSLGLPVVYYISPQIWAWRQGRVRTIRDRVDRVLTIFPFENEFYRRHQVPCDFVGHPLLDELEGPSAGEEPQRQQRQRYGVDEGHIVLGLMPGSRRSEIKFNLEVQLQAARILRREFRHLKVMLLVAPGLEAQEMKARLEGLRFPIVLVQDEPMKMISGTDLVLCASGTATLMVGLMLKPLVIMYRMNALTAFLAKLLVRRKRFFGMVNLIMGELIAPELFQEQATAENLAAELRPLIQSAEQRQEVCRKLERLPEKLGQKGVTRRVAEVLSRYF